MNKHPFLMFFASLGMVFLLIVVVALFGFYSLFGHKTPILKSDAIGVLKIEGLIYDAETVLTVLKDWKNDNHIKALLVRIDSPGGVVGPSQEIYQALKEFRKKKKVVASLGAVAASGGYYVACAADQIVANPGTLTGSIGVIMEFVHLQKLYQWAKIDNSVIKSGKYKDMGSPFRAMEEDERKLLSEVIYNIHNQFKQVVASERKMAAARIDELADGRIFSGDQAKSYGLVDKLGNFETAVEALETLAGLEKGIELTYPSKKKESVMDYIVGENTTESVNKFISGIVFKSPAMYLMPGYF